MSTSFKFLERQHVLLDTCILANALKYSESQYFDDFFNILKSNHATPVINEFVQFEFLRGCKTKKYSSKTSRSK